MKVYKEGKFSSKEIQDYCVETELSLEYASTRQLGMA